MTQYSDSPKTFTAGEAIAAYLRCKLLGRTAYLADAGDYGVGTALEGVASGAPIGIRLWGHGGSYKMVAAGVIATGGLVYAAANGKIAATGTRIIGTALDAASGDNSVIEVVSHLGHTQSSSSSSSSSS